MSCLQNDRAADRPGHRYQLRYAAGVYWLVNIEQPGGSYISPVPLNEGGAKIWSMLENGTSMTDICEQLSGEYDIPPEQAREDVRDFITQLHSKRIDFGGLE